MPQISGIDVRVIGYDETSYGVDPSPTPAGRVLNLSKLSLTGTQKLVDSPILTAGRGRLRPARGNIEVTGGASTTLAPNTLGWWLKYILGAPVTTGASSPYTHTFIPKTLPIGIALDKDYTSKLASKVERFNGVRVASADFKFPQQGAATLDMSLLGTNHQIKTSVLDASPDTYAHDQWSGFNGLVKVDGTQVGNIISGGLKIDNSMPGGPFCFPAAGGVAGVRTSNPEGRALISGSLEMVFEDFTLLEAAIAGTGKEFIFEYKFGTGAGTAGNEKVTFKVTNADLERLSPTLETESGLILTMAYQGYAVSPAMGLEVVLMNSQATV